MRPPLSSFSNRELKQFLWVWLLLSVAFLCGRATAQSNSGSILTSGGTLKVMNPNGYTLVTFEELPSGSPATVSVTVQGGMRGGTLDTAADTNTTASAVNRSVAFTKAYDYFLVTASWTGGTSPTYVINTRQSGSAASGSGSNVTVVGPLDGSGYINVDCKTGCTGGNANGQATMANSAPVVIASNQSALSTTDNLTQVAGQVLGAIANYGTSPGAVLVPGFNAFITNIPAVSQSGTWNMTVNAALPAGGNTIGAVTQGTSPWVDNITQYGGTNISTGTGAGGAGIPRVTVSSDSSLAANQSVNVNQVAGSTLVADPCQTNTRVPVAINLTASGQLIAGTSAKQTYICYLQFALSATADNVALVEGTGSTCGTGTAGMAGGATAATGWNLTGSSTVTSGMIQNWAFKTATAADNVCLLASSAAQISGTVVYVQQ